jgi:DUF1365 family protein
VNTHLLRGKVVHRRSRPTKYALEHDVWYVALDLDELGTVGRWSRLLRHNARSIVELRDSDYMPTPATDLAAAMRGHLAASGIDIAGGHLTLVTSPRVLGYQFNPASFYFFRGISGGLEAVVVEVHNTHGERHLYTLRPDRPGATTFSARMDKDFYVSPFIGPAADYRVTVRDEAGLLAIGINERETGDPLLATSLALRRLPLSRRNLITLLVRYPLISHKTTVLIHWHALRLWLKGVPFHRHARTLDGAAAHRPAR